MTDDLTERATDLFLDAVNSDANCTATYPAVHDAARAVVALVLDEAARVAETEGVGPTVNMADGGPVWFKHAKRIAYAIRALGPKP